MTRGNLDKELRTARRVVSTGVCLLLVALVAATLVIQRVQAGQRDDLTGRFDTRQATAAHFIQAYVEGVFDRERILASRNLTGPVAAEDFDRFSLDQAFGAAVLLDDHGRLLAAYPSNPALVGKDMTTYAHLASATSGMPAVSGVVPSAVEGRPVIGFAVPFDTPDGRRVFSGAYLVEDTPLESFARDATPFRTAEVMLVDTNGVIVAGQAPGLAGRALAEVDQSLAGMRPASGYLGAGDDSRYVTHGPVDGTSWRLVFTVRTAELFSPLQATQRWALWWALAAFAAAALLALTTFYRYLVQRARLSAADAHRRAILDTAGDAFVGMDERGRITDWNAAAVPLFGWTSEAAIGQQLTHLLVPPDHHGAHQKAVKLFLDTGRTTLPDEPAQLKAMRRDGTSVDVEMRLSRMYWDSAWHFHAFLRDITDRVEHETQLKALALTDSLTGLANRRSAVDRLQQALARARRRGQEVAVIFIDVDRFKAVNDGHGHAAGDTVLTIVADRLRATFRAEDTIARFGGDEFVVVCEDLATLEALDTLVTRTRGALAQPYAIAGAHLRLTASVGAASSDGHTTVERLLNHADAEMYDAKATRETFAALTGASD